MLPLTTAEKHTFYQLNVSYTQKLGGKTCLDQCIGYTKKPKTIYNQTGEDHVRQNQIQIY